MRAKLTTEAGETRPGELDLEPDQPVSLGRSRDNTVVLRSEHASRLHAKIFCEDDRWFIRDFGLNGTLLNGERIPQQAELEHGHEIRIGEIRMRFTVADATPSVALSRVFASERGAATTTSTVRLQAGEVTLLCGFMASHAGEADQQVLFREALVMLLNQTNAYVAGLLSPDAADPLPKVVVPDSAGIDPTLARQMTRRVQRDGKTAWLGTDLSESRPADALKEVTDALCVPLRSTAGPLGMIHVYKKGEFFSERDVGFAEALADFLAGWLKGKRVRRNLAAECARLRAHPPAVDELIGDSPPMVQLRQRIAELAGKPVPVLIRGEPGVGVDLVAESLHRQGPRAAGPFVTFPCGTYAPALLEAELFGHRSPTAAEPQPGACLAADEGSLFLDELTALSLDCQGRLLRVIEDKTVRPVGGTGELRADVRVITATRFDLDAVAAQGRFRKPLLDRLNAAIIDVPPLRTHLADIPFLVQYFLDKLAAETHRAVTVSDAAMRALQSYLWPGNLRQLRAELEVAILRSNSDVIDAGDVLVGCEKLLQK
jgi:transcriptional regulator with GAF, ATPase, and Fis domain